MISTDSTPADVCPPSENDLELDPNDVTLGDPEVLVALAQDDLAKIPPAISGQGGRSTTWRAVHAVAPLGVDVGLSLLLEHYNPRCIPPWDPKELRRMLVRSTDPKNGKNGEAKQALDPDLLHAAYSALLGSLKISADDQAALRDRGFSPVEIGKAVYRSNPTDIDARKRAMAAVVLAVGPAFTKVPGMYDTPYHPDWTARGDGQLIPVRDPHGRIIGIRFRFLKRRETKDGSPIRKDGAQIVDKVYAWLSATKDHPTPMRTACVHHPVFGQDLPVDTVEITEGEYKADRATLGLGRRVISIPGVGSWPLALEAARELGAASIVVSLDADASSNRDVARAIIGLCEDAAKQGLRVAVRTWRLEDGKGLDDLIQAGRIESSAVLEGDELEAHLDELGRRHKIPRRLTTPTLDEVADLVESPPAGEPDWRKQLQRSGKRLRSSAHNVRLYLAHAAKWKGMIGWDEFNQRVCWAPPIADVESSRRPRGTAWSEADTTALLLDLSALGIDYQRGPLRHLVQFVAAANPYHPVREYLGELVWDGTPRLATWCHHYLGAPDTPYEATVGQWWMVQAVRRIYAPGSPAKYILTLEGDQDIGKSTALRILCGDQWFSDSPWHVGTLAGQLGLSGVWFQELAEGSILTKADEAELKAAIGQTSDHYVRKFENEAVSVPRQVSFAMSINPKSMGYLHDTTGNVRYWPVSCTRIDFDRLRADRDQLWAEAVHHYRQGVVPEPRTPEERLLLREVVAHREVEDAWQSTIETGVAHRAEVTVVEVMSEILEIPPKHQTPRDQGRVKRILLGLGYELTRPRGDDGRRARLYVRTSESDSDVEDYDATEAIEAALDGI